MSNTVSRKWNLMDPIEVWRIVQEGIELKKFPNNYLDQKTCKILVRHLLLNDLKLTREEILTVDDNLLSSYQLGGVRKFFDCKLYKLLMYCFPEFEINEWEVKKASPKIWEDINIRNKHVRYVAKLENIDLTNMNDIKRLSARLFQEKYKGSKALIYAGGLYPLIKPVIPAEIKEWQLFKVSKWDDKKAKEAVEWLLKKLNWKSEDEIASKLSASIFYKNNLGGLLGKFFDNSPQKAIRICYPNLKLKNTNPFM